MITQEASIKGVITFADDTMSKVTIVRIDSYYHLPSDYWFKYDEGEKHRPLIHPDYEDEFPLPEAIKNIVFKEIDTKDTLNRSKGATSE